MTLEIALNRIPQIVPAFSASSNNPSAGGAAYVDLRGLGIGRNLILVDGRRVVGANASGSVDLNTIPIALIDRVEVVTGGASAVYGADAVAGVVNVILRRDFTGAEANMRTLVSQYGDGREHDLSASYGLRSGDVRASAHVGWSKREEIGKGARTFSANATTPSVFFPGGAYLAGLNAPSQSAVDQVFAAYGVRPGAVGVRGGFAGFGFNPDGTLFATGIPNSTAFDVQNLRRPAAETVGSLLPDVYAYNFEPFNKLVLPLDRLSGALIAEIDLTPRASVSTRIFYTRYDASTALAPTPALTDPNPLYPGFNVPGLTIPVTNPFIPADLRTLLSSRTGNVPALAGAGPNEEFIYRFRTTELGPRQSDNRAETLQALIDLDVQLKGDWRAQAQFGWGDSTRNERQSGLLSVRRAQQLLRSPSGGNEFCVGGFNPFGAPISPSCRAFLSVAAAYRSKNTLRTGGVTLQGTALVLPAGPVLAHLGLEHRSVSFEFRPPSDLSPGEVAGFSFQSALRGTVEATDAFAEIAVPVSGALDLRLGFRASKEPDADLANSAKADLSWRATRSLTASLSVQRALRSADVFERFQPVTRSTAIAIDPCARTVPASREPQARPPEVLAICRAQAAALGFAPGVADAFVQDTIDLPALLSGTPTLEPEAAHSLSMGLVWRPRLDSAWLQDIHVGVSGYDIRIDNAIGYADAQQVLNACYRGSADLSAPACAQFARSAATFAIVDLRTPQTNKTVLATSGVEVDVRADADLVALTERPWAGRLETSLSVTRLLRFEEQAPLLQRRIDLAGTISGIAPAYQALPNWRATLSVGWISGPARLDLVGRYIGEQEHRAKRIDPNAAATGVNETFYWDLAANWRLSPSVDVGFGVLNLANQPPQRYFPAVDGVTDPSTYDVVGRRFWLSLRLRS